MFVSQFAKKYITTPLLPLLNGNRSIYINAALAAARKGTRMKREAIKKAAKKNKPVVKEEYIPYRLRLEREKIGKVSPRIDDSNRGYPVDDVFFRGPYKWIVYTVEEAVKMHQETQHPTQFNDPTCNLYAQVELSMTANKKNQYISEFSNIVYLPHCINKNHTRTLLVLCKDEEMVEEIKKTEVTEAVGPEAIRMIEKGQIDVGAYDYILSHSSLLPDLISIRGQLKRKFPSPKNGTASVNLIPLINRFLYGTEYKVVKDNYDHDFGMIEVKIGTVDMDPALIEENLRILVNDIEENRPKTRSARVITLVTLKCANTKERFKVDFGQYLPPEDVEQEAAASKT